MHNPDDPIKERYEDMEDMMDHMYEHLMESVYTYTLCTKLALPTTSKEVLKTLLLNFVEIEFDDLYARLIPYVETKGRESVIYGLIQKS